MTSTTPSNMLFGTLLFWDSMTKPQHLDSATVDWRYPIQTNPDKLNLPNTRLVRACYRSKRIDITALTGLGLAGINASVFVQNTDALVSGAVRLYLWRKSQTQSQTQSQVQTQYQLQDLAVPLYGNGWSPHTDSNGNVTYTFISPGGPGGPALLGRINDYPVPNNTYTLIWTIAELTTGSITISYGETFVNVTSGGVAEANSSNTNYRVGTVVTHNITTSGSSNVVAASTDRLRILPTSDFDGILSMRVVNPFGIRPVQVGGEDFLELVCNTRSVTHGMAIGSASVNSAFDYMQVVVMQPCSGVSVYVGPQAIDPGPIVGPAI